VLAISPQDVDSHARWAEQEHFEFPLLADTDKKVIEAYGVAAPVVGVRRSVFIVDTSGAIRWRFSGGVRAIFKKPRQLARILEGIT
jgi:thioredoxin-dependent peroxiredoxin